MFYQVYENPTASFNKDMLKYVNGISGHSSVLVNWSSWSHFGSEVEALDYAAANMKQTITLPLSRSQSFFNSYGSQYQSH